MDQQQTSGFSFKALFFGLAGLFVIAWGAGNVELRMPFAASLVNSHLPTAPFCLIILLALGWNLVVKRFPALSLSSRELTVVMALMLVACFPPTAGMFRFFQRQLTLPWYYLASGGQTEWEKFRILEYIPSYLFPTPAPSVQDGIVQMDSTVYRGLFQGLGRGTDGIPLSAVPWSAWVGPLMYWGPLICLMSIAIVALAFLVHRQWAVHEQLSYPLAQVLSTLVTRKPGSVVPDLFRNRLFWWGALPVLFLYVLDYLNQWFPMSVPGLKTLLPNLKSWNVPLQQYFPALTKSDGFWYLCSQTLMFSVVGAAYFVASEISLTMGLSQLLVVLFGAWFYATTGTPITARNDIGLMRGGAYLAYAIVLLYTGRTYYGAVVRNLFRRRLADAESRLPVLAARTLALAFTGFTVMLVVMGLDWFIAILFALLVMLLFLVFTRIICETGVPFMQAHWWPAPLLTTLLGPAAVGPGPLVLIGFFGTVLAMDPRECLMPYVATGVKMADDAKMRLTKLFGILMGATLVALAVGFVSVTWTQYAYGGITDQGYASKTVPTDTFNRTAKIISEMSDTGVLEPSRTLHGLSKLKMANPDPGDLGLLAAGAVGVFVFFLLRFQFPRFPLHPVLFLVWGVYATSVVWFSFLVGWVAKTLIVRFGGGRVYHHLRPLFVGLIAGELAIVGIAIVVDVIYYWITGKPPGIQFKVLAG